MTTNISTPSHGSSNPVAADLAHPHVLLVDDQPARLLTYESILEGVGVTCVRALSGREALERLLRQAFAVIVLDVSMPEMDGFETARLIRDHPRFERTPIIFVTGVHTSELDTLRGYEAGAIDYIPVPIVPEILRSKVALLVELYRRRSELERLNRELEITRTRLEVESRNSREQSRAHLEDSERRYRAIFEHPALMTVVLEALRDSTGAIIDWCYRDANANALRLLNRSRQSLAGERLSELLPDRAGRLCPLYAKVLASKGPYHYEAQVGETDFLISLFPMDENTIVSSGLDITSRIRVEREAQRASDADRAEKEWLSAVLNSMNEEVYFTNIHKRYTYANPAALREFGHTSVENVDVESVVRALEVLRPDGTPRPLSEAPPLRALEGEVIRGEEQLVRIPRTGELRHRQVSSAPVRGSNGDIIGSVSVVRDITDRARAEQALRTSAQQLRDADRRKDEFIAMLAHELRNPLVPIRTGVELLKAVRERPQLLDSIRPMMERQIGHMVRMIDDLLDVSRISSGKIELQRRPVTLATVVGSAIEANRAAIDANDLDLTVNLSEPHWTLNVDPTRFTQVISNLLQNAAKFTPRGGSISVSVAIEHANGPCPELLLKVADSGIGISAEMLPRVFELFAQGPHSGHSTQSGLGIGLALARRLVEMHGGTIEARSDGIGSGSEFAIKLAAPRGIDLKDAASTCEQRTLEGIRVLLIDDNRDSVDTTAMFVGGKGAITKVAYDGESGLATLSNFKPDVVLLDIGMPTLDGYEVCRRIRAVMGASVGIVAITGWGQQQDKQRATRAGFNAHLTKPADPVELEKTIRSLGGNITR